MLDVISATDTGTSQNIVKCRSNYARAVVTRTILSAIARKRRLLSVLIVFVTEEKKLAIACAVTLVLSSVGR